MDEKKYTYEGFLIVTETDKCPLWELSDEPRLFAPTSDCFYCRYAEFRTPEFIRKAENMPKNGRLLSVCHNEKNKKPDLDIE